MSTNKLRQNLVFLAGWALTGLAIALVVSQLWQGSTRQPATARTSSDTPVRSAPAADPALVSPSLISTHFGGANNIAQTAAMPAVENVALPTPVDSYAPAVRATAPAVVSVYTLRKVTVPRQQQQTPRGPQWVPAHDELEEGLGSGVILDAQGHIVTNNHVIENADRIRVELADGRRTDAIAIGTDPATDLAVLKIDLPRLPVMPMGRSDRLAVGDVVLAIGNPFGLTQTVTHGIISATGRKFLGLVASLEDFLQTDAAINHGNSGGALINARGELIGINTAVLGKELGADGLSLAIPVDLVRGVVNEIVQNGKVVRGWIGAAVKLYSQAEASREGAPYTGLIVIGLANNSSALRTGGLTIGDKIETMDAQPVSTTQEVGSRIAGHKPGSVLKITGLRWNKQTRSVSPFSAEVHVLSDTEAAAAADEH